MIKKLTKIGNSYGILIDKAILDLLNISPDTEIEVTTDGHRLVLEPASPERAARFEASVDRVFKKHAETFRKLAK